MRGGQFEVSLEMLGELLGLPAGAVIRAVVGDAAQQGIRRTVTFVVEHPDLCEVAEGAMVPEIIPSFEDVPGLRSKLVDWGV